jgi:chaperonin GroES
MEETMGFTPLQDRVVVSRFSEETKTAGGIILPDTAQEKPSEGTIVAVGNGTRGEDGSITPLDVKKGDHVLFGKFGGTEIKVDGEELMILRESDILGIIDKPKKKSK